MLAIPEVEVVSMTAPLPVFLTVREVCLILRRSESFVRRRIKSGAIPHRKMGRLLMVPREHLQAVFDLSDGAVAAALRTAEVVAAHAHRSHR